MLIELGGTLTVWVQTKNSSGVATAPDAAAAPTYAVYEGDQDTPLLSGTMTGPINSETGLYKASLSVTSGNGFERGQTYLFRAEYTITSTRTDEQTFTVV